MQHTDNVLLSWGMYRRWWCHKRLCALHWCLIHKTRNCLKLSCAGPSESAPWSTLDVIALQGHWCCKFAEYACGELEDSGYEAWQNNVCTKQMVLSRGINESFSAHVNVVIWVIFFCCLLTTRRVRFASIHLIFLQTFGNILYLRDYLHKKIRIGICKLKLCYMIFWLVSF